MRSFRRPTPPLLIPPEIPPEHISWPVGMASGVEWVRDEWTSVDSKAPAVPSTYADLGGGE